MFRLLGIHPGPDIGLPAAASLAAVPVEHARKALDELARAYLVVEHQPGRFTFHDLLRAYAAEQARMHESVDGIEEAVRRLLDYYLRAMHAGELLVYPARLKVELPQPCQVRWRRISAPTSRRWRFAAQSVTSSRRW